MKTPKGEALEYLKEKVRGLNTASRDGIIEEAIDIALSKQKEEIIKVIDKIKYINDYGQEDINLAELKQKIKRR